MRLNARDPLIALLLVIGAMSAAPAVADTVDFQLPRHSFDLKPAPLPDEGQAHQLIVDEAYRHDGAITNMRTCIEVAGDPAALVLWQKQEPDAPGPPLRLSGGRADREDASGAGTLHACEQIVASWQSSLQDRAADDGRVEHGALVLDFAGSPPVDPTPLVRLLASPGLLPPLIFGGIIVRNAEIDGTLLLYNLHLTRPLVFVHVTFRGGGYPKGLFSEKDIEDAAISVQHSKFDEYVAVLNSTLCGDVLIHDSQFRESLQVAKTTQDMREECSSDPRLFLQGNQFARRSTSIGLASAASTRSATTSTRFCYQTMNSGIGLKYKTMTSRRSTSMARRSRHISRSCTTGSSATFLSRPPTRSKRNRRLRGSRASRSGATRSVVASASSISAQRR